MADVLGVLFSGDPTPIIGGGTVVALVSISVTLLYRMAKVVPQAYIEQIETLETSQASQRKQHNEDVAAIRAHYNDEVSELRRQNAECLRTRNLLIRTMQRAGVTIPDEVWP